MSRASVTGPLSCLRASLEYTTFRGQGHCALSQAQILVWTAVPKGSTSKLLREVVHPPSLITGSSHRGPGACAVEHASFCVVEVFPDVFTYKHGQIPVKITFLHF